MLGQHHPVCGQLRLHYGQFIVMEKEKPKLDFAKDSEVRHATARIACSRDTRPGYDNRLSAMIVI